MVSTPDFKKTRRFLRRLQELEFDSILHRYGREGVKALSAMTPVDTGLTASSWTYQVTKDGSKRQLVWTNTVKAGEIPLVVLLHYGHATGSGAYIPGANFIVKALEPVFKGVKDSISLEVRRK